MEKYEQQAEQQKQTENSQQNNKLESDDMQQQIESAQSNSKNVSTESGSGNSSEQSERKLDNAEKLMLPKNSNILLRMLGVPDGYSCRDMPEAYKHYESLLPVDKRGDEIWTPISIGFLGIVSLICGFMFKATGLIITGLLCIPLTLFFLHLEMRDCFAAHDLTIDDIIKQEITNGDDDIKLLAERYGLPEEEIHKIIQQFNPDK